MKTLEEHIKEIEAKGGEFYLSAYAKAKDKKTKINYEVYKYADDTAVAIKQYGSEITVENYSTVEKAYDAVVAVLRAVDGLRFYDF